MISAEIAPKEMEKFRRIIAKKADTLHLSARTVVRNEAGRLVNTLITLTPPADRKLSAQNIDKRVRQKFKSLEQDLSAHDHANKSGSGNVTWYAFQPDAIFGVAKDKDLRKATAEELYNLFFQTKLNRQGRIQAGRRGKQTVYIWQRIITKTETVKRLAKRLISHLGRAKAGWLVSLDGIRAAGFRGGKTIPRWISEHNKPGKVRGKFLNSLQDPRIPRLEIENHAKGISSRLMSAIVKKALEIRIKAMEKRIAYLAKYPEKIAEEQ